MFMYSVQVNKLYNIIIGLINYSPGLDGSHAKLVREN